MTRLGLLLASTVAGGPRIAHAAAQPASAWSPGPLTPSVLPPGVRSRFVDRINGLRVHVLEAGDPRQPCVLLLHGFPELAYSWRKIIGSLADVGVHVLAPDLRGYGRTTGWDHRYDTDLSPFGLLNYVRDALALVSAFGHRSVAAVVGHDFGSVVAPWCPIARPDVFRALVMMSAPFAGVPPLPFDIVRAPREGAGPSNASGTLDEALARLNPPRKQYRVYYATRAANDDMLRAPQGLHAFLRAYYHMKSADWKANVPFRLTASSASEFAKLPTYYVMNLHKTMPETVAEAMPSATEVAACRWLTEDELRVYAEEYGRTGFQGGLDGYRVRLTDRHTSELQLFSGRTVDVPSTFIGGKADWGVLQTPGAFESMQKTACTRLDAVHLIDGAGHWVQQEQPDAVLRALLPFIRQQISR
ncbi:MAG: alpha/beta hydrolase [Acidimicrobiia bacterium]|nr:alpha/beta hydrolase [Acidimicrobiia bacterium]